MMKVMTTGGPLIIEEIMGHFHFMSVNTNFSPEIFIVTPRLHMDMKKYGSTGSTIRSPSQDETFMGIPVAIVQLGYNHGEYMDMSKEYFAFM